MQHEQSNPFPDELLERMVQLLHKLGATQEEIAAAMRPPRRKRPVAPFPFSVLEHILHAGLAAVERTISRLVRAVVR
jgi:hypothetical protein